jgi:hypothetical protein
LFDRRRFGTEVARAKNETPSADDFDSAAVAGDCRFGGNATFSEDRKVIVCYRDANAAVSADAK